MGKCNKKVKCGDCPDRCTFPPIINKAKLDGTNFFDLSCEDFLLFDNISTAQAHTGATVTYHSMNKFLSVKYVNCAGGPSPGVAFIFKTRPCTKYSVDLTAVLKQGDQAFIQIESIHPPGKLRSEDVISANIAQNFKFIFQAVSEFTVIGVFFYCDTRDYCLRLCDLKVKSCDKCETCPIICEQWKPCKKVEDDCQQCCHSLESHTTY